MNKKKESKMNKVLSVRKFKAGYELRKELIDDDFEMTSAYNRSGDYIGNSKTAYRLCVKKGIAPEKADPSDNTCTIGFSQRNNRWYGWSHRAICGFKIGDVVKEGDCCAISGFTDEYLKDHPEEDKSLPVGFEAKTLGDAKKMAIAFAESVG